MQKVVELAAIEFYADKPCEVGERMVIKYSRSSEMICILATTCL